MVVRPVARGGVVEVFAPAGVTREGRPVTAQAPVVSRDAAAVHPVVVAPPPPVRAAPATYDRGQHGVGPSVAAPGQAPGWNGQTGVVARPMPTPGSPASAPPAGGPVSPRQNVADTSGGQPLVQPMLKPEVMGGQRGEGPVLHPLPPSRAEIAPGPPPARTQTPSAQVAAPAAPRTVAAPVRARPVPPKAEDKDKKVRAEPKDR
jgi:hypothetical protein